MYTQTIYLESGVKRFAISAILYPIFIHTLTERVNHCEQLCIVRSFPDVCPSKQVHFFTHTQYSHLARPLLALSSPLARA